MVQEIPCEPSRSTLLQSGTYAQHKCWLRDVNQLKSEFADHQVPVLGSYKERCSAIETRIDLDER